LAASRGYDDGDLRIAHQSVRIIAASLLRMVRSGGEAERVLNAVVGDLATGIRSLLDILLKSHARPSTNS
jgi:hypothetical protein